jgi:glycosyl-4,4'-diaponeurosporenoate acyltransferase
MADALGCALGWLGWSLLVGSLANRLPAAWLAHDSWLTQPRAWGERAAVYERRLAIRRWKRWLPDAGNALPGGVRKAALVRPDRATLQQLCVETRRAELVHLALWPFWLVTALWLPPLGVAFNLLFATAFNLPCLWVQRYNRLRLQALLQRMPRD